MNLFKQIKIGRRVDNCVNNASTGRLEGAHHDAVESDNDVWVEQTISVFNKTVPYYTSMKTSRWKLMEPPTGALVLYEESELYKHAEVQHFVAQQSCQHHRRQVAELASKYLQQVCPLSIDKYFKTVVKSEDDVWIERILYTTKTKTFYYYTSLKHGNHQLCEPPTDAKVIIS